MFDSIREKILASSSLDSIRRKYADKRIVFCTGCYDILQSGHAVFFSQCKSFGDILVVGVGRDSVILQLKGPGRPVNPEINRQYLVAAMQQVDYAVLNDGIIEPGKIDFRTILEELRPDVFVINADDNALGEKSLLCKSLSIQLQTVPRIVPPELEATSTTRIIDKINFSWKAPLRIDFAGGWTDVPFIMEGRTGYVSNVAIKPLIDCRNGQFNFSGYPRGSGLSTSTAVKVIEMIGAKSYNAYSRSLNQIAEDLFNLENLELNWAIGRQDQYSIVYGGFNCFEFQTDHAKQLPISIPGNILSAFHKKLLLIHSGVSRNAQSAVEQVYKNFKTASGSQALQKLATLGLQFAGALQKGEFEACAGIMEANFNVQKELAVATSNAYLDEVYDFAKQHGAYGGKICGAGGGGAFIFCCSDPNALKLKLKKQFVDCFEIDFEFEFKNIKELNQV